MVGYVQAIPARMTFCGDELTLTSLAEFQLFEQK